jgi:hypothetical protein
LKVVGVFAVFGAPLTATQYIIESIRSEDRKLRNSACMSKEDGKSPRARKGLQ